jgi:DNA-binding MarR family transcriptional regulator
VSGEAATRSGGELRSVAGAGRDGGPGPDDGRSERVQRIAQRIAQRMRAMAHAHDLRRARAATALGMSETRVEALRLVAAAPEPLTMGQLAARLHTDRPYASTVVDDLERHGLVLRARHPDDRRVRIVTPTGEGRRVAQRAERMLGDTRQLLQTLPPDDLAAVERVLDHLQARPA